MKTRNYRIWSVIFMVCLFICALPVHAATVAISWLANSESDLSGYRVYYGTSAGAYTNVLDAGKSTEIQVGDLPAGKVYYFAVTAYNQTAESGYSDEICVSIPQSKDGTSATQTDTSALDASGSSAGGCFIATAL